METIDVASTTGTAQRQLKVFISYSRSEAMLVDDLADRLKSQGFETWVDYRNLVPGLEWDDQLRDAVADADVVVIVMSRRAMASSYVEDEWDQALDGSTPMVVVVAEAAPLHPKLTDKPWVDLRVRYGSRVDELAGELRRVVAAAADPDAGMPAAVPAPPETGFRAPLRVWLAFLASIPIAVSSLFAFWTIVVPLVLVPLPIRILKRSFNYVAVRNALLALPLATLATDTAIGRSDDTTPIGDVAFSLALFVGPVLFLLIRGGSFRRWVHPVAARAKNVRVYETDETGTPEPVRYRVDVAAQDRRYAELVAESLDHHHHERVDDDDAPVVLRFVSQFHDVADIDRGVVTIPIVLADADDEMPRRLRRTQWIDFRRGVNYERLQALGRHLDEPAELFQVIGTPPPHDQQVLPKGVQGLVVSLWIGIGTTLGLAFLLLYGLRGELDVIGTGAWIWSGVIGLVTAAVMLWMTRKLSLRTPGRLRASLLPLIVIGQFATLAPVTTDEVEAALSTEGLNALENVYLAPGITSVLILYFWIFKAPAIRRWIPSHTAGDDADGAALAGSTRI